jgi:superfamily I DNA/RNA helicase
MISLSKEQQHLLLEEDKALLISGGPGSGKSLLALAMIAHELKKDRGLFNQEVLLYVTESEQLAQKMREEFDGQQHVNPYEKRVVIRSYKALLLEKGIVTSVDDIVNKERFKSYLSEYIKRPIHRQNPTLKDMQKTVDCEDDTNKLIELIYQEFRILSGYDLVHYVSNDKNALFIQSLFSKMAHRQWLGEAYKGYLASLDKEKYVHPAFFAFSDNNIGSYSAIWVDEAQDLSHLQLKLIHQWCSSDRVIYLNDPNQILDDHLTKTRFVKDMCREGQFAQFTLSGTYRCPQDVVRLANAILKLKLLLTRGVLDKEQQRELHLTVEQEGLLFSESALDWNDSLESMAEKDVFLQKIKGSAQVAIVTLEKYKEKAKELFQTVSVFTADEIKGLEFEYVVVYQLLDETLYADAGRDSIMAEIGSKETPKYRAKEGQEQAQYGPLLNRLYTAVTRCTKHLTVIQAPGHKINPLINYLKDSVQLNPNADLNAVLSSIAQDTPASWLKRAEESYEQNEDYAREIFINRLGKTEQEFTQWKKQQFQPTPLPILEKSLISIKPVEKAKPIEKTQLTKKKNQTIETKKKPLDVFERIDEAINKTDILYVRKLIQANISDKELHYLVSQPSGLALFWDACVDSKTGIILTNNKSFFEKLCVILPNKTNKEEKLPSLYYLAREQHTDNFSKLLSKAKFAQNLTEYKAISSVLFCINTSKGVGYNTTVFYYLMLTSTGHQILQECIRKKTLFNGSKSQKEAQLKQCIDVMYAFYTYSSQTIFSYFFSLSTFKSLKSFLSIPGFHKELTTHANFSTAMLSISSISQSSPLQRSMKFDEGRKVIQLLLNDDLIAKLAMDESFVDSLLINKGVIVNEQREMLFNFLGNEIGLELFHKLLLHPLFVTNLISRKELYPLLFKPIPINVQQGPANLLWIIFSYLDVFNALCSSPLFLQNLCSHPLFYTSFFPTQTNDNYLGYCESLFFDNLAEEKLFYENEQFLKQLAKMPELKLNLDTGIYCLVSENKTITLHQCLNNCEAGRKILSYVNQDEMHTSIQSEIGFFKTVPDESKPVTENAQANKDVNERELGKSLG